LNLARHEAETAQKRLRELEERDQSKTQTQSFSQHHARNTGQNIAETRNTAQTHLNPSSNFETSSQASFSSSVSGFRVQNQQRNVITANHHANFQTQNSRQNSQTGSRTSFSNPPSNSSSFKNNPSSQQVFNLQQQNQLGRSQNLSTNVSSNQNQNNASLIQRQGSVDLTPGLPPHKQQQMERQQIQQQILMHQQQQQQLDPNYQNQQQQQGQRRTSGSQQQAPPVSNVTRYGTKHPMFERRSSSLDRPWNTQSQTQVIGNGPAGSPSGGAGIPIAGQVQRSTSQSSLFLQPKAPTNNRVSFKQVSFEDGSNTSDFEVQSSLQGSYSESSKNADNKKPSNKISKLFNSAKKRMSLRGKTGSESSQGTGGFNTKPTIQITTAESFDGSDVASTHSIPRSILKKKGSVSNSAINSSGRDFRNASHSAGNQRAALHSASQTSQQHQPFQRNNSVDSPQTQARVLHGTQSSSYNSMSQFSAQRGGQQMQRQGSGSSTSMLFSGNGTGLVQSRQAGRISINAGSMAGRTGVMRFSTDSQSSFGAR